MGKGLEGGVKPVWNGGAVCVCVQVCTYMWVHVCAYMCTCEYVHVAVYVCAHMCVAGSVLESQVARQPAARSWVPV